MDVKFTIGMDNRVQAGDSTIEEIIADMQAGGIPNPNAANQVRDPTSGKLIQTDVHLPEASATVADNAINGNPGVAINGGAEPIPLTMLDLVDIIDTGIPLNPGGAGAGALQWCTVGYAQLSGGGFGNPLGLIPFIDSIFHGTAGVYLDNGNVNPNPGASPASFMWVRNRSLVALTISSGSLDLDFGPGPNLTLTTTQDIVIPALSSLTDDTKYQWFYIDAVGRLYRRMLFNGPSDPANFFLPSYAATVATGQY